MGQLYIANYANEIAYHEDNRRTSNSNIFKNVWKPYSLTNGLDIGKVITVYQKNSKQKLS